MPFIPQNAALAAGEGGKRQERGRKDKSKAKSGPGESLTQRPSHHFPQPAHEPGIFSAFMDVTASETRGKHTMIIIAAAFSTHSLKEHEAGILLPSRVLAAP